MSSSEKAKTPGTFEERNPFDIARHSGPEVATEIANRMAAWKTARARTSAAPTTIPGPEAKPAPIAAPVQPARVPKASAQAAPSAAPRVPYFASASATRRAMPPAPSLKQPARDQPAPVATEPVPQIAAPMPEQASPIDIPPALDPVPAAAAPAVTETPIADITPIEDSLLVAAVTDAPPDPAEPSDAIEAAHPQGAHIDDKERIRAEARAIRARWIAAHDLDSFVEAEGNAAAAPAAEAAAADAEAVTVRRDTPADDEEQAARLAPERAAVTEAASETEEAPARVETLDQAAPQTVDRDVAPTAIDVAALDDLAGRKEPTFDAPAPPETLGHELGEEAPAPQFAAAREDLPDRATHIGAAAPDEIAGRKEPTFDAPDIEKRDEAIEKSRAPQIAAEPPALADISLAALDEMAGRKEPTFDGPIRQAAPSNEPAADAAPKEEQATVELPRLDTAPLAHAARRSEPAPAVESTPAAPIIVPRVKLRPIETRIEARRIDALRAEPELSAGPPILSHDEGEDWDMPPALAAKASRARRGTGWAIGLGSVLLIAGITAPAAIWQQGRQDQDRVAAVTALPAPPQAEVSAPAATPSSTVPAQVPAQATLLAAPQADVTDTAPKSTEDFDTVLRAIGDGVEVQEAPVMTPPPPAETLANAGPAPAGTLMVARPFVPESGDGPFLRAPAGTTPVPLAGAKPGLVVQLKPKVVATAAKPAVSKAKPVARQPKPFFQQSPDQMFNTLIETLTEGRPPNPATKPQSPSTRR